MTDPLTTIQAAATAIGITAVVEVGDEQELNMLLDDAIDYPLAAVMRIGADGDRKTFRPGYSASYYLNWQCIVYLLDKVPLDDTGAARHVTSVALIGQAIKLAAQVQVGGGTALQTKQPDKASFSVLSYNMFDVNLAGVVMALSIPDTFEYCITPSVTFGEITVGGIIACIETPISVDITVDAGEISNVQVIYSGANVGAAYMTPSGGTWSIGTIIFTSAGTTSLFIRVTFADGSTQDSDPVEFEAVECGQPII